MKILHVITDLASGGAEAALHRLISADTGNEHTVVSLRTCGLVGERLVADGVRVTALEMPRGMVTPRGCWRLYRAIRSVRPDLIQTWLYHADLLGGLVGRIAGVRPIIWSIRAPFDRHLSSATTRAVVWLCARLSRRLPAAVVSNSSFAVAAHQAAGYRPARFVMVPNGYPLEQFQPDSAARARLDQAHGTSGLVLLGMVARHDSHKDHDNLFAALARLPRDTRVACLLIGLGMTTDNAALAMEIDRRGVNDTVRLLGLRKDTASIMAGLDVHVLSSAAESFPNVLAEAMACGTPCVSTDVGDARAIVGDTGWIVPPRNPEALAQAILSAVDAYSTSEWAARKAACRTRIAENYSLEKMVASYNELWHAVAA